MTRISYLRLTAAAVVCAAAIPALAADHPVTGEKLAETQTFSYRILDEIPTLDPQLNEDTSGSNALRDLFEGLMNQDAEGNLVPGVASGFEATDGNRTYVFTLRPEAKWSNGDPVVAGDFVYAWQRAIDPATASPYAWFVEMTTMKNAARIMAGELPPSDLGVTAVDDHTLKVELEQPIPYFAAMTTNTTFFPAHKATIEQFGSEWTRPGNMVSNGAYMLAEHVPNEYHSRVKNPKYWDAGNVIIEKVTGFVINDENQALTRYLAGEVDKTDMPAGQFPEMKAKYPDEATSVPRLCNYYYSFNMTDSANPALKDVRVRRALSYAVDRDVIVNAVLKGGQSPAYGFVHTATAGFEAPDFPYARMTQAERDAEAVKMLTEAGYGRGGQPLNLRLIYNTSESHKKIATVMAQMWKQKLGVEAELINYEWKTYLDIRGNQDFDVARNAWCGDYNEASTFLSLMETDNDSNDGKYSNAEVDKLMTASQTMADPGPAYAQIEAIVEQDVPVVPVYFYADAFMLKPDLKGWPYENVEQNWYSKDFYRVAE